MTNMEQQWRAIEREGWKGKKSVIEGRTHGFQLRSASPFTDRFKEPEHCALQRFGGILPGDILEMGRKVRTRRLNVEELDRQSQYERPCAYLTKPWPYARKSLLHIVLVLLFRGFLHDLLFRNPHLI